eukprot:TRINITY_DN66067_c1_g2_i1.p1 TRINITY_DN66067_c1_g2~~TRINITY_DN66067_c1_g2_i1.p1  ORF type:complete len:472 (-),score=60.76 TRINITY_DN66067_c1_g2_i1:141-1556(-)
MVKFVFVILGLTAFLAGFMMHSFFTTQQPTSVEWVVPRDIQRDLDAARAEIQKLHGVLDDRYERLGMLRVLDHETVARDYHRAQLDAIAADQAVALERAAATVQEINQQTVTQATTQVAAATARAAATTAATTTSSRTAKPKSKPTSSSKTTKSSSTKGSTKKASTALSRVPIIQYTSSLKPTPPPCGFGEIIRMNAGFSECIYKNGEGDLVSDVLRGAHAWGECDSLRDKFVQAVPNAADGVFLDVGANLGTCGFYVAHLGGKVFAFEPVTDNAKLLQYSLTYNKFKTYNFLNAAAAQKTGTAVINIEQHNRGNSIVGEMDQAGLTHLTGGRTGGYKQEHIPLIRIDDYVHEHVNLMKLDCQGHELPALQGAEKLIRNYGIDRMVFEYSPPWMRRKGIVPIALLQQVWNFGFDVYRDGAILAPETWENFIAGLGDMEASFLDLDAVYSGPRSSPIPLAGNNGYTANSVSG